MTTNKATAIRCKRACVSACADVYGKSPMKKNPAHLPKCGEKVTTFKTWGLLRFKMVKC